MRSLLQQRPDTFAQTILSFSFFACKTAADHTFPIGDKNGAAGAAVAELAILTLYGPDERTSSPSRLCSVKFQPIRYQQAAIQNP